MDEETVTADQPADAPAKKDYKKAFEMIQEREKELKDKWHDKEGKRTWEIYLGDAVGVPFNILYSNTETVVPAVFSQKPIPKVLRRYDEERADVPAKAMRRMLEFCMDTNLPSYPNFMTAVEDAVLDAALPGQGMFRLRIVNSLPVLDYVAWDKFVWAYCERWEDHMWEAFRHDMQPDDVISSFKLGEDAARLFKSKCGSSEDKNSLTDEKKPNTVLVYEYWNKNTLQRCFLCEEAENCCLLEEADPLGLENFFPTPNPLKFIHSTTDTMPRALYKLYREQAEELNEITRRIKAVTKAIKVRGIYAGNLPELPKLFERDDDNILVPSEDGSQILSMQKGLDAYIWMVPIDKLIVVLEKLFLARDQVKGTIYEILGIGDILRGVSKASETLGAQKLKDKWGSLRINKVRDRTANFIREGLRLLAEGAAKHTPAELWEQVTGLKLASPIEGMLRAQQGQMALPGMAPQGAMGAPNLGTPPQPEQSAPAQPAAPAPPPMDWATVLKILQNDLSRAYTIDVETDSTVDPEATAQKEELSEFMNAFGQAMSGLAPLAEGSPEGFEAAKAILVGIISKFDLGEEVEPLLRKLPVPKSLQGLPPEVAKLQQELQQREQKVKQAEEAVAQDQQLAKDLIAESKATADAIKMAQEKLNRDRAQAAEDQKMRLQEIDLAKGNAVLEIKTAGVEVKAQKAELAAQRKAQAAAAKPPGGA